METLSISTALHKDLEGAHRQTQETLQQLVGRAGKMFAKKPVDGLREIRGFLRGVYHGHTLVLQHAPAVKDAPPEEQDELSVVDTEECLALLKQHLDIESAIASTAETIAIEYARHRRRIRLCMAGLNHKPAPVASTPDKKETPPPLKQAVKEATKPAPTKPATRHKPAAAVHDTPETPLDAPQSGDDDTGFEVGAAPGTDEEPDWQALGIDAEVTTPAHGQKTVRRKP